MGLGSVSNLDQNIQLHLLLACPNPPPGSDLWISKRASMEPVEVGKAVTYTLTVMNFGPDDATVLPLPITCTRSSFVSADSSQAHAAMRDSLLHVIWEEWPPVVRQRLQLLSLPQRHPRPSPIRQASHPPAPIPPFQIIQHQKIRGQ